MKINDILDTIPTRSTSTGTGLNKKYGIFGLSLGEDLKIRLDAYCNKNDIAKLFLLESYPSNFIMTINARALRHIFDLRLDKSAHFIFRDLMRKIRDVLPYSHIILYEDILKKHNEL